MKAIESIEPTAREATSTEVNGGPIRQALDMPWRAAIELKRWLALPYIRLMFKAHGVAWGRGWRVFGMPVIQRYRGSHMVLGDNLEIRSWPTANPLLINHSVVFATRTHDAIIKIGDGCGFTGTVIVAAERIEIGARVLVGANSSIVDTDFHPLDPCERQRHPQAGRHQPVIIEDDVFIGMNSLILKGVTIGRGSVIGAGSVVTRSIPADVIAAGNPARVIRAIGPSADGEQTLGIN